MKVDTEARGTKWRERDSAQAEIAYPPARVSVLRQIPYAIQALRPKQWIKNVFVLPAMVFAYRLTDVATVERTGLAFVAFCMAASTIYVVNDIADREKDRHHPRKRWRPIASGRLSVPLAVLTALLCAGGAAAVTAYLVLRIAAAPGQPTAPANIEAPLFAITLGSYVVMNLAYSAWLKHLVLWDVLVLAAGFVLRALAGAFAAMVPISPWFYVCTLFLALFLALGKRRAELEMLSAGAALHRANLQEYTTQLLDQLIGVTVTCALITYSLYTFQSETGSHALMITIPFVIFVIFRYLYLIYVKSGGDRPDEVLWRDRQILGAAVLCALVVISVLYGVPVIRSHWPVS